MVANLKWNYKTKFYNIIFKINIMKKYLLPFFFVVIALDSYAQKTNTATVLMRQETITLKAADCAWLVKSISKNSTSSSSGNSIPEFFLKAIEQGKLKAFDSWTDEPIPAKEIYTWRMPIDTLDASSDGVFKYEVLQHKRTGDSIKQIRVCQDWYFDGKENKLFSIIKWIEFIEPDPNHIYRRKSDFEVDLIPFCRIYY